MVKSLAVVIPDDLYATLVAARTLTTNERRYSLDEVLAFFGYTREQSNETLESSPTTDSDVRLGAITKGARERVSVELELNVLAHVLVRRFV